MRTDGRTAIGKDKTQPTNGKSVCTYAASKSASLFLLALFVVAAQADDKAPTVRHIFVPVHQREMWPKGEYEPLPFEEYVKLRNANQPVEPKPRGTTIEWQSLSATFDPQRGVLTDGHWTAEVRGKSNVAGPTTPSSGPRLMSLEPLDLPISELKWSDRDAIWGTTPSGEPMVVVDSTARRLEGKFSRQGRRLQRTWQFDLSLATAMVSELKLRVPAKFSLKCSSGTVRGPLTTSEQDWRLWDVNLGSQSHCEVLIVDSPTIPPTEPIVVYEQTSSYVLREAEIEIQCEINAEIFHTPKATLSLNVPDDLSIYTVGFAGDTRLTWKELPRLQGQPRQIQIVLPEPQIGRVRALQLLGGMTAKWDSSSVLPRVTLANGWFVNGRWNVSVDAPLVWRALSPRGLRLTEVNATSPTTRRLSFIQFLSDASLELDISSPEVQLTSHGIQRLTARETTWRLTSEWLWGSNGGVTFSARCRIPTGWEVLDVQSLPENAASQVRHWDVIKDVNGDHVLVIDFSTPLEGQAEYRINVVARRPRLIDSDRDEFELPTPLDCRHSEQLLVLQTPAGWKWHSSNEEAQPATTAVKRIGSPWIDFESWKEDSPGWTAATLLVRATQIGEPLRPLVAFLRDETPPANSTLNVDTLNLPLATRTTEQHPASLTDVSAAFREASTERLVWTTADLKSLIFPGGDGDDMHVLTLKAAQVARVGRLEFDLSSPAELVAVRMNGVRTEPQQDGHRFRLPDIPQGGLQTLEIAYHLPSDRDFLRNRQSIPVPHVDAPVLGFRWVFALPPDARLTEEPSGLRLLQPLEPTPWSRRFFGPLGRDQSQKLFNPFSSEAWQELWTPNETTVGENTTLETLFAPPGWRVREAVAATLPTEISWLTWSGSKVRVLAWIGMLLSISVGCLLRVRQAKPRVHIAALWLGVCAVGVVLSAPVYAEVLGGCFVGAVIAALIPRRLVMSYATQRAAAGRGAFEATVALQRVLGAIVITTMIVSSVDAQEIEANANSTSSRPSTFDVLIPVDNPLDATGETIQPSEKLPLVFVPKELLQQWRQRLARDVEPSSLMESARYEVDWQDGPAASIRAEFVIHRLALHKPVTLRFPYTTVPLAGKNACLVDGQPRAVAISEDREALLLELPAIDARGTLKTTDETIENDAETDELRPNKEPIVTHRVVFTLIPPANVEESPQRLKLQIPPTLATDVVVKSPPKVEVELQNRRGEAHSNVAAGVWSAQLGKQSEWLLELGRPGTARQRRPVEVKADVTCLAELMPTALRQHYRVRYSVAAGEINDVVWLLPRGTLLREGDVTAEGLLQWSLEPQADGRQRLIVEFNRPKTGEFVVDVIGLQPSVAVPSAELLRWEPWTIDADQGVIGAGRIALGVSSTPGFKVTAPSDAERIAPLSEAAFMKNWGTTGLARQPQVTLQLLTPVELSFSIAPLVPQRKVRQELLLKLGRRAFEWALYSEVTTAGSPAFQHDVKLAPHFRADEVSVTEDEAERLVSWTQADQRLSLFLRDSTLGIQNVVLQGRDAMPADGRLAVPTRWFTNADVSEFSVRVTHDPSWQVEILGDDQKPLSPSDPGGAIPDQPDLVLGKFRVDPKMASFELRLTPHQPAGHATAWTQISLAPGKSWSWRHVERLLDEGQITARVFWPTAWAESGSVTLSSSLKELARRTLPDGIELTVQSLPEVSGPRELFFESKPPAPPSTTSTATPTARVAPPTSLDVAERTHHWLIDEELSTWLPISLSGETRPFADTANLPERLEMAASTEPVSWLAIPNVSVLELERPAAASASPSPKLVWMETTVWLSNGAITQGQTWLLLQPHGLRELILDRPDDVRWIAAFVGDKAQDLPEATADQFLRLDDLPNESLLWISIFWQIEGIQSDRIVARRDARLPMPAEASLRPPRHDVTLISSGHTDLSSTRGARRVQDWDARLGRAASILEAFSTNSAPLTPALRRLWTLAENDLADARQTIEKLPIAVTNNSSGRSNSTPIEGQALNHESAREKLKKLLVEANAVRSRLTATGPLSPAVSPAESWTSDAWHLIPESWNAVAELDQSARLSIIVVDRRWLGWMTALLAAVIVIPLFRGWLRWQTGEWLAEHPQLAWASLGAIWWTSLAPSLVGLGLLIFALAVAIRNRWQKTTTAMPTPA